MNVEMVGRHVEITPALREFAEEKLRKLERLLDGPLEAHVVLAIEKHRHLAEIQLKAPNVILSGAEETGDLYASIGLVVDKLERQALKHKEKTRDSKKHRQGPRDPDIAAAIEATVAEASGAAEPRGNDGVPRIVRGGSYRAKPLALEDAALALEDSGQDILVFRDAETDRLSVLYRRPDGDFGLVEPDF